MRLPVLPIAALMALPGGAWAQGGAPVAVPAGPGMPNATMMAEPVALLLAGFDRDGDAIVTRAEAEAGVAASVRAIAPAAGATLGYIDYADWALRWLGDRNALPSPFEVDADGNNRITAGELTARLLATFDRLDRDKDARLTRAELLSIRGMTAPPPGRGKRK